MPATDTDPTPPNIVYVFSDQHRNSAMGCSGNEDVLTPNFDRLAGQGRRYTHAFANYPICSPSRASLLSGQYPLSHGVITNDIQLSPRIPTIGTVLKEAGYRTGYIGKWHLDGRPRDRFTPPGPRRQGFDDFWAVYNCSHDYYNAKYYFNDDPNPIEIEGYEPIHQTDLAIEFIDESVENEEPFCLFLSWGPPHDPYDHVPDEYRDQYDANDIELRSNVEPILPTDHEKHPAPSLLMAPPIREWLFDGEVYDYDTPREGLADYYAAVTALDAQFGRLMDYLEATGVEQNTILVYSSDHGDMFWSQGKNQKGQPYEEAINIPFIIRWPDKIPANDVDDTLLSVVDIAPTLLGLADIRPPETMEGSDLSKTILGHDGESPGYVYLMNVQAGWRGIRTSRYTYARLPDNVDEYTHLPDGNGWILFDNEVDPYQMNNLVLDPDYDEVRSHLHRRLNQWLEQQNDPFYTSADGYKFEHLT